MFNLVVVSVLALLATQRYVSSSDEIKKVNITASWVKVMDYDNHDTKYVTMHTRGTKGLKVRRSRHDRMIASHDVGTTLKTGANFALLSVEAEFRYSFGQTTEHLTLTETEIYETTDVMVTSFVPPGKRLITWQLVADVAGNPLGFDQFCNTIDDGDVPQIQSCRATISQRQKITGLFRIKHKERNEFLTVVSRKGWPAATLGHNPSFYFDFYGTGHGGHRIRTMNSSYPGYDMMYSSSAGGIYFDIGRDSTAQYWIISKHLPLEDGDIVTFKNTGWDDSGLCYYSGYTTNVYCLYDMGDEWIVMI